MVHKQSWWSKRYKGTIEVKLADGKTFKVAIHRDGTSVWINRKLVHPSNSGSLEGAIDEIGIIHDSRVKEWEWVDYREW